MQQQQLSPSKTPLLQDDLFQTILTQNNENIQQSTQAALRNSMMARGAQDGFTGKVWPLIRKNSSIRNMEEIMDSQYGLQGILLKESPSFFGGWDQRYVVLRGQRFVYKENASPISANAGILNFNLLSCDVNSQKNGNFIASFRILIKNGEKQFVFKANNNKKTQEWYQTVLKAVKNSQAYNKNNSHLTKYPRFWRKDYLGQSQFRRTAEPGDILLFRGKKDTSVMQRAITMDQYGICGYNTDHIGVVLLNQMGEPLILEANGGFGVGICPWIKFIEKGWWKQYELVVHRKLNIERTQYFLQKIEAFVGANMGKQYNFSLSDYFFQRKSSKDKEHSFFFCSSLVAKLYKILQLLPASKSCKQYLPSSFDERTNLKLRSDGMFGYALLDVEKIIVFQGK